MTEMGEIRTFTAKVLVPRAIADEMDRLCGGTGEDLGHKENLFDQEVHFPGGMMVSIQVCPADEAAAWTQGVLFSKDDQGAFHEVTCTEVQDRLTGTYVLDDDDAEYWVTVEAGDVESTTVEIEEKTW